MKYHVSPVDNLHRIGIMVGKPTTCSVWKKSQHVYVGSLNYIFTQYLKYAPKQRYYLYEVDVEGLYLEKLPAGEQWRTHQVIPERVELIGVVYND